MRIDRVSTPTLQVVAAPRMTVVDEQPRESFATRVKHGLGESLVSGGNDWKMAVGGATGLVSGGLFLYGGLVGGALIGAAVGGGIAPMIASLGSQGVSSFFGTALATTRGAAFVGMAAGAATGLFGGWKVGKAAASLPGNAAHWAGTKLLGYDPEGATQKPGTMLNIKSKPMQILGTGLVGVLGAAPGLVGGAVLGGGVASAGSLFSGLLAHNVTLQSVLGTGMTGAAIGGALGVVAGVAGGIAVFQGLRRGGGKVIDAERQTHLYLNLEQKEKLLAELTPPVAALTEELKANNQAAHSEHDARVGPLEVEEKRVAAESARVGEKETNAPTLIEQRAQQLYNETKTALQSRDDKQVSRQTHLDAEDKRVDSKIASKVELVDQAQNKLYNDRERILENLFQDRKHALENRDGALHQAEKDIPKTVEQKVLATLAPLKADLAHRKENTIKSDANTVTLHNQAAADNTATSSIKGHTQEQVQATDQARQHAQSLRVEQQGVQQQVTQLHSQNENRKIELDRRETAIYDRLQGDLTSREGQLNDYANRINSKTQESFQRELGPRENELRGRIDGARNEESQARGRRDTYVAAANQAANTKSQAQAAVNQATSEHSAAQTQVNNMVTAIGTLQTQLAECKGEKQMLDEKERDIVARENAAGKPHRGEVSFARVNSQASSFEWPSSNFEAGATTPYVAFQAAPVARREVDVTPFQATPAWNSADGATKSLSHDLHDRLEAQYQERKGRLDQRERELQRVESEIPQVVAQKVEQALNPLRQELSEHQENARRYDAEALTLQSQTASDQASISGLQSEAQSERQAAAQARQRADGLRAELGPLNQEVTNLRNQNEARKEDLDQREQALNS